MFPKALCFASMRLMCRHLAKFAYLIPSNMTTVRALSLKKPSTVNLNSAVVLNEREWLLALLAHKTKVLLACFDLGHGFSPKRLIDIWD